MEKKGKEAFQKQVLPVELLLPPQTLQLHFLVQEKISTIIASLQRV